MLLLANIYKVILLQLLLLGYEPTKADEQERITKSPSNGNNTPTYDEILERRRVTADMLYAKILSQMPNMSFHAPPLGSEVMPVQLYGHLIYLLETNVQVLVRIERIDHMDVTSETLTFTASVGFVWQDDNLQWDPQSGVYQLILDPTRIWTPPVIASGVINYVVLNDYNQVVVDYKGLASQILNVKYTVPCEVNVLDFPFDKHTCQVKLSQLYNGGMRIKFKEKVDQNLRRKAGDVYIFNQKGAHAEWELTDWNNSVYYEPNEFTNTFQLTIVLQRRALFHAVVLLLPCIILNTLSLVTFIIPADTPARVDITLSLIVAYFVLLMILVETMPPSGSKIPILGFYLCSSVCILAIELLFSGLLVKFHTWQSLGVKVPTLLGCCLTKANGYYDKRDMERSDSSNQRIMEESKYQVMDAKELTGKLYKFSFSDLGVNVFAQRGRFNVTESNQEGDQDQQRSSLNQLKWDIIIRNLNRVSLCIVIVLHLILIAFIYLFWIL